MIDNNVLESTRISLNFWGRWCYKIITMQLGYSKQSLISRLQTNGGLIIHSTHQPDSPPNPHAEQVNRAVEALAERDNKICANILRIHYTMTEHHYHYRVTLSRLSETSYRRYLHKGEEWVAEYLITH